MLEETRYVLKGQVTALAEQIADAKKKLDHFEKSLADAQRARDEAKADYDRLVNRRQAVLDDLQEP